MTPELGKTPGTAPSATRSKRAPFELLAFTAAPVAGALVVVELEGRFAGAQGGRFARQPVLVVESGEDRPRLELAPVRATLADGRWRSAYAIPAEAYPSARFALGLRGTLLELPAPDEPDDADRLTALAREANALRRALETAEAEVAATSADLGAAVLAARDEALAESTDRITALEAALAGAAAAREEALAELTARAEAAEQQAVDARESLADVAVRAEAAERDALEAREGLADADARARAAEEAARAATSGIEVLRAELAEERERSSAGIAELEAELEAARRRAAEVDATTPRAGGGDAARSLTAERDVPLPPGDDATLPLDAVDPGEDDATRPLATADGATSPRRPVTLSSRRARVVGPDDTAPAGTHAAIERRGVGPWIAVGALVLFAFVLLGLLAGFLG